MKNRLSMSSMLLNKIKWVGKYSLTSLCYFIIFCLFFVAEKSSLPKGDGEDTYLILDTSASMEGQPFSDLMKTARTFLNGNINKVFYISILCLHLTYLVMYLAKWNIMYMY